MSERKGSAIPMQSVESSNIAAVGFEGGPPAILQISFKGGGVYQYTSDDDTVVQEHFTEIMKAESKGRHFTAHVRHDKRLNTKRVDRIDPNAPQPKNA